MPTERGKKNCSFTLKKTFNMFCIQHCTRENDFVYLLKVRAQIADPVLMNFGRELNSWERSGSCRFQFDNRRLSVNSTNFINAKVRLF